MSDPFVTKFITTTKAGSKIKSPITIHYTGGRIEFLKSPFSLKDELKAFKGARWHGFDPNNPRKIWSALDCERNHFQIQCLMGENAYSWWDQPLEKWEYDRPLYAHQELMANHMLTYHYCIIAAELGLGKTLSAIECMEQSGHKTWWWAAPKSALKAVEREFDKWGLSSDINLELMTYEKLRSVMKGWKDGDVPPPGVVFDESSRLKNASAQRTVAAQNLADSIREQYGKDGYTILMSGTPAPKSPVDWWSLGEIAWPGFLREGSMQSFERRMAIFAEKETMQGKHFQRVTWLDDENKCRHCGSYEEGHDEDHDFEPSFNEVSYLHKRLQGLTLVLRKDDCLDLPDKIYRTVKLPPSATLTRVAKALVKVAPNVITGLTWMRELSDGFQYQDIEKGVEKCPVCEDGTIEVWTDPEDSTRVFEMVDMLDSNYVATLEKKQVGCSRCEGTQEAAKIVRIAKEIPCAKDDAIRQLLEECEEQGRLVIFAGFTGSIDRITANCLKQKWAVVRVDGRGWKVYDLDGNFIQVKPLDYWTDFDNVRVAFVAHPRSGGLGLTLTESRMAVFYSNDFSGESRSQAEDRIHRIGMDENKGATIVDLIHLPTDEKVRDILKSNRKLERMTLGEMFDEN
jgi:SNF2 family DNA or RNA helicase